MTPSWLVWVWLDSDGRQVYCGKAQDVAGIAPWDALWGGRHQLRSNLGDWLQGLPEPPRRDPDVAEGPWTADGAKAVYDSIRSRHGGWLDDRPRRRLGTYAGGYKAPKPVEIRGQRYPSVSAAARALGLSNAAVSLNVSDPKKLDWRAINE